MYEDLIKIYKILSDKKYHTASEISIHLNISERTTRKFIKEIKELLKNKDLQIISTSSKGYILQGKILKENEIFFSNNKIPNSIEERENYLIERLINLKDFIKIETLSKELFIGTRTISIDIKKIEKQLNQYNLKIIRKPHYGIKLSGSEINVRNLLVEILEKKINDNKIIDDIYGLNINNMAKQIYKFLKNKNVKISDIALQNLVIFIYICIKRTNNNFNIDEINLKKDNLFIQKRELISSCLNTLFKNIKLTENDIDYITIRFLSNETLKYINVNTQNITDIKNLIDEIFYYTNLTFQINLYNDDELYKNLYTHLLALSIRLRFDIKISNPLLDDIKENLPLEYNISFYISKILKNKYNKKLSESEIAYIALILSMSSEFNNKNNAKKNILIVCPSGKGVSKFLVHTYSNLFAEYSNIISSCGVNELLDMDLTHIDIIFTLVDIEYEINKPIYKINYFLKDEEIIKLKNILKKDESYIKNLFSKKIFTYIDRPTSKNEIINIMSKKFKTLKNMPENIEKLLIKRENLGLTEICPDIAIPHSIEFIENVNIIGVCITKYPVLWQENELNLILFILLDNKNNKNKYAYRILTKLVNDKSAIKNIIKNPNYKNFITIMENFYNKEKIT